MGESKGESPIVSEDSNSEVCSHSSHGSCPDCHELDKKAESGDSDSAVSSMSSFGCAPLKPSIQADKYVRETLV